MQTKSSVWTDLTTQLQGWIDNKMAGNGYSGRFDTGFGGPRRPNEEMSTEDFNSLVVDWTAHGKTISMSTRYAKSLSGGAEDVWDLLCTKYGLETPKFNYHIKVPGKKGM